MGRMGLSSGISSSEAQHKGYHKCFRCYEGECIVIKTKLSKHKAHHKHGDKQQEEASTSGYTSHPLVEPWFYCL